MSSNIVISDVLEMTIAFLKSREAVDTDEGLTYLFNRLMLEKTQKAYYRFIEKQYDSIAIMASMISKISTMLEIQKGNILKMQTQIATLLKQKKHGSAKEMCDDVMVLK